MCDCSHERSIDAARPHRAPTEHTGPARVSAWSGEQPFLVACALLFTLTAVSTIYWCGSMPPGMDMPGGWTMSMAWMQMPGQTWVGAATLFLAMWLLMMMAMMLPSLVPMLLRYRRVLRASAGGRLVAQSGLAGGGYFAVWTAVGALAYVPGVLLAQLAMQSPALALCTPATTGIALVLLGVVQMSDWKLGQLESCRSDKPYRTVTAGTRSAWIQGVHLGLCCVRCSGNLMLVLLLGGVMDLRLMALLTAAVSAERLAPAPRVVARAVGAVIVAAGLFMLVASGRPV